MALANPPKPKRQRTPAQLANDRKMKERAAATKAALAAQNADAATDGSEVSADDNEDAEYIQAQDVFAQAGTMFQKLSAEGRLSRADADSLYETLGKIDPLKNPEIADHPAVEAFLARMNDRKQKDPSLAPGSLMGTGLAASKKVWTHADVMHRMLEHINTGEGEPGFKPRTFIPMENKLIVWNGLAVRVIAGEEATVPECYFEIYANSLIAKKSAEQHVELMFRSRDRMDPGKTDVTIMGNDATARVRGAGMGTYLPGEGGFDVVEAAS